MTIKDELRLNNNTLTLLDDGFMLILTTIKGRKIIVQLQSKESK